MKFRENWSNGQNVEMAKPERGWWCHNPASPCPIRKESRL